MSSTCSGCTELDDDLGSEVLFVGGSASVYLTASEHFRGEADADCIYFADDLVLVLNCDKYMKNV
jgi:hypothetical protein